MNDYILFRFNWTEEDYGHLDEGIRVLVKALHQYRIRTIMSCEGHIRESWFYTGVLPYPWVILILNPSDLKRIQSKLEEWNRENKNEKWILSKQRIHGSFTPDYIRSAVICGDNTLTVTALVPKDDNEKKLSAATLAAFQQQVPKLASFISA
jgi:hypothetical protein